MEPLTHSNLCSNHPEWNESYYFAFFNRDCNIGGVSRIGFKPNKREGMSFFFLFLPDGSVGGYHQEITVQDYKDKLQVKEMIHLNLPDGRWNYNFSGKMIIVQNPETLPKVRENPKLIKEIQSVQMNLNFEPINKVYEYSKYMTPESLEIGKKAGDKHWEQIGNIEGEIAIGDSKFSIYNTMGQRDHTYGVRDWVGVGNWLYYVVWFNRDLAVNPAAIITDDGRLSTGGFLFRDGKNIPLKEIKILNQQFREDQIFPVSSKLELIDIFHQKYILKAFVGPIIPVPFIDNEGKQSILVQSLGSFELDGIKGGYGTYETLRKIENNY